jgi:hypothetical protein
VVVAARITFFGPLQPTGLWIFVLCSLRAFEPPPCQCNMSNAVRKRLTEKTTPVREEIEEEAVDDEDAVAGCRGSPIKSARRHILESQKAFNKTGLVW